MHSKNVAEPFRSIVNEFAPHVPPFREGEIVEIKGNKHLGLHRVDSCEWFTPTNTSVTAYWLCECSAIREPIDWSKIPAGATGIVTSSGWRGSAVHLTGCKP